MSLTWNDLGLVEKVSLNDTVLVNYSYLADDTKVSALDDEGNGLLYLGSLIYRKTGSCIELESAGFAGGRFVARETADGSIMVPMIHVTDHLGSVRAVIDGVSGEVVETDDYYPFGSRWDVATGLTDQTNRFRYNSKEEQFRFGTPYIDYGARQYDPVLGRWFAQDPLSEKYYGISPYAFCAGNPVKLVDPDGEYLETAFDITSIVAGIGSLVNNIRSGNTKEAIYDGLGIAVDVLAAATPFIPGGVGIARTGAKAATALNAVDNVTDAAKGAETALDAGTDVAKAGGDVLDTGSAAGERIYVTYTKTNPVTGEVYSGRTSGYGTPKEIVAKRDMNHHMNGKGFGKAVIDKSSTNSDAIRGQEQYLIELNGGAKSKKGTSGNAINGISPTNSNKQRYEDERKRVFGY